MILLPDEGFGDSYGAVMGPNGARRLKDWVQSAGTLIGLGAGAVQYLADPRHALLDVRQENAANEEPPKTPAPQPAAAPSSTPASPSATATPVTPDSGRVAGKILKSAEDYDKATQPDTELPFSAHGFLARARADTEHWLGAGAQEIVYPLLRGVRLSHPSKWTRAGTSLHTRVPIKSLPAVISGTSTRNSSPSNRSLSISGTDEGT